MFLDVVVLPGSFVLLALWICHPIAFKPLYFWWKVTYSSHFGYLLRDKFFSLTTSKILFLSWILKRLTIICLGLNVFVVIPLGIGWAFGEAFNQIWANFSHCFYKYIFFLFLSSLSSSLRFPLHVYYCIRCCPQSLRLFDFLHSFSLSFCSLGQIIFIGASLNSLFLLPGQICYWSPLVSFLF